MAIHAKKLMAKSQITTMTATLPLLIVAPPFFEPILMFSDLQVEVRTYRYALNI